MRFKCKADLDEITKEKGQVNIPKIWYSYNFLVSSV